jgi:hypothetical protein
MQTGLTQVQLPFSDTPENIVSTVIEKVTLPEFSTWEPLRLSFGIRLQNLKKVRDHLTNTTTSYIPDVDGNVKYNASDPRRLSMNEYWLPDEIVRYNIMTVDMVTQDLDHFADDDIAYTWYMGNVTDLAPTLIDAIAYSNLVGQMGFKSSWEYIPPNRLILRGFFDNIKIKAQFEHKSLQTIPRNSYSEFTELALYDVKNYCYQILKNYDGITTSYGTINIKIDEWSSASADRKAFLDNIKNLYINGQDDWIDFLD